MVFYFRILKPKKQNNIMDNTGGLTLQQCCETNVARHFSTEELLINRKNSLEQKLKEINEALEFLQKNPDFAKGIELLAKVTKY